MRRNKIDLFAISVDDWLMKTNSMSLNETGAYVQIMYAYLSGYELSVGKESGIFNICHAFTPGEKRSVMRVLKSVFYIAENKYKSDHLDDILSLMLKPKSVFLTKNVRRHIYESDRQFIKSRDDETCQYCGTKDGPFHIDHIVPVFRGGGNNIENLTLACRDCNLKKGHKLLSGDGGENVH